MSLAAGPWGWLSALQRFGVRPGLERIRGILDDLGQPERAFASILVAGTNGKGSVTALLESMLRASGRRTGRFVSPHLEHFDERIRVAGEHVDPSLLQDVAERVRARCEARGCTYFEALTAIALTAFARCEVEVVVLEVGMGGRFDATNVVDPVLSVVTSVDLDHTEVLGSTVEEIARDKAGVARAGRTLVVGAVGPALEVVVAEAERVGADAWALERARWSARSRGWRGVGVTTEVPGGGTWRLATPLVGRHQARNLATAAAAASALGVDETAARRGARAVAWPGRLERLHALGRAWILDGAHNPAGARALASALGELEPDGVDVMVVGISADKDLAGVLEPLVGSCRALIATRAASSARAAAAETIVAAARRLVGDAVDVEAVAEPYSAIARALERSPDGGTVLVAGSLFLVGEARTLLRGGVPAAGERHQ